MILAIRTDKPEAEIYLLKDDQTVDSITWQAHRQLADTIHQKINELLSKNGIDLADIKGLVVYKGPGSFTGLRIGISVANTIAYALNIPIVGSAGDDWLPRGAKNLSNAQDDKIVNPFYGKEANITKPKK